MRKVFIFALVLGLSSLAFAVPGYDTKVLDFDRLPDEANTSLNLGFPFAASAPMFFTTNDVYIADVAAGANDGSSCGSAKAKSYFNSAGNWSATPTGIQIGPDTTVHLCGTIDGGSNHSTPILTRQGNGTSGHPVTIKFESGAIVQAQVCPADGGAVGNGGCISLFNGSFFTVEGNNTGSASLGTLSGGGTIQNTDNGDALGHHCGSPSPSNTTDCISTLIDAFKCSNCTIQNLKMLNTYVKVLNNTSTGVGGDQQHSDTLSGSHITITNNQIANCGWCIFDNYTNGDTDVNVSLNDISGFGHGMMYATANAGAQSISPALRFYSNNIHDPNNWTTSACNFHNDGLHMFGLLTGTSMDGLYIHDNYFHGTWGHCATGFLYLENGSSNPSHAKTWAVWNNVGDFTTETTWNNTNGWFGMFSGESGTQLVANNTLYGPTTLTGTSSQMLCYANQTLSGLTFRDNAGVFCPNPVQMITVTLTNGNNNFYGPTNCFDTGNCFSWNSSPPFRGSFSAWKTACSCDAASGMADAKIDVSSGTNVTVASNVLTVKTLLNTFVPAQTASFRSFIVSTYLNGSTGTLATTSSTQFTVNPFVHANTSTSDNGVATINPLINSDGSPASGSQLIGLGANLSALATGELAGLQNDTTLGGTRTAVARPGGATAWDTGAFQFASGTVADPTFSPVAGTYTGTQSITISTSTSLATICYTTNGSNPTTNGNGTCTGGTTYTTPVSVPASATIKAIATKNLLTDSNIVSAAYVIRPTADLSPTSFTFASTTINTNSATTNVTLTNNGGSTLTITTIAITVDTTDFTKVSTTCGATLTVTSSCTVTIRFNPTTIGAKSANLTFTTDAPTSPDNVALTGTGTSLPTVSLSPSSLTFGAQVVNTTSAGQTVTLTNTGTQSMTISSIALVTGTNYSIFSTNCSGSLGGGSNCLVTIKFTPLGTGTITDTLRFTTNAASSPDNLAITGLGQSGSVPTGIGLSKGYFD